MFHRCLLARGWQSCAGVISSKTRTLGVDRGGRGGNEWKQASTSPPYHHANDGTRVRGGSPASAASERVPSSAPLIVSGSSLVAADPLQGNIPYDSTPIRQRRESSASFMIQQRVEHVTAGPQGRGPETKHVDWAKPETLPVIETPPGSPVDKLRARKDVR